MKVNFEELKTFVEAGDEKAFTQHIFNSLEKGDITLAVTTNTAVKSDWDSEKDKHHNTALETWKANNLNTLVEDELKKRNPDKSPAEIEVDKLRKEIEDERKGRTRETLKNKALEIASDKGLPKGVLDFFIGEDEETTIANLTALETEVTAAIQAGVDAKFKASGRDINQGSNGGITGGTLDIAAMAAKASIRNQKQE